MDKKQGNYVFEISLSILDHLGRNLYRNFVTILGEAISNSWDADAKNVWIYVNEDSFVIKDDGTGMDNDDFQGKFLRVGYSKRKDNDSKSPKGRPFIGRKGIGKLALLSCAKKVVVASRKNGADYVGGLINNSDLDQVIKDDLTPDKYPLEPLDLRIFGDLTKDHSHGTLLHFENVRDGIRNSTDFLKKITALYFRFSLIDNDFNIYINDELVTLDDIKDLANKTEYLWTINEFDDPYVKESLKHLTDGARKSVGTTEGIGGFIASVLTPKNLSILSTGERVSIDLFVNGRLRERDILKGTPTARIAESYLYGQIHFNQLDNGEDKFTSSREGVVADDGEYQTFLATIKSIVGSIVNDWDKLRVAAGNDGNPENNRITQKERKSRSLVGTVSKEFVSDNASPAAKRWVTDLSEDAQFNVSSYTECFIAENLVRKYINEKSIAMTTVAQGQIQEWKDRETENKRLANINIDIMRGGEDISLEGTPKLRHLF